MLASFSLLFSFSHSMPSPLASTLHFLIWPHSLFSEYLCFGVQWLNWGICALFLQLLQRASHYDRLSLSTWQHWLRQTLKLSWIFPPGVVHSESPSISAVFSFIPSVLSFSFELLSVLFLVSSSLMLPPAFFTLPFVRVLWPVLRQQFQLHLRSILVLLPPLKLSSLQLT